MSWPNWPAAPTALGAATSAAVLPAATAVAAAAAAMPAGMQYSPEQWAQMQQQNWQQWAQWQQQYQQWHQQYGAEYQKSMSAMTAAGNVQLPAMPAISSMAAPTPTVGNPPLPPLPVSNASFNPAPPPAEPAYNTRPPLPTAPAPQTQNYSTQPPPQTYKSQQVSYKTQPPSYNTQQSSYNAQQQQPAFNAQQSSFNAQQSSYNTQQQPPSYNTQPPPANLNQNAHSRTNWQQNKRGFDRDGNDFDNNKRHMKNRNDWNRPAPNASNNYNPVGGGGGGVSGGNDQPWRNSSQGNMNAPAPPVQPQQSKPISQKTFEEISEAEKKFDKEFAAWEEQFNKWKEQNANHPDKEQYREYEKKWESWRNSLLERREQMRKKRLSLMGTNTPTAEGQKTTFEPPKPLLPTPTSEPIRSFESASKTSAPPVLELPPKELIMQEEMQEEENMFLKSSQSGGIPGLDLVKEGEELDPKHDKGKEPEVIELEKEKPGPDLHAISKGINTILGDQNLMNMLTKVAAATKTVTATNTPLVSETPAPVVQQNEYSNQSGEDRSSLGGGGPDYQMHRESVNNFDDQTRSSFTLGPSDNFESAYSNSGNNNRNFGFGANNNQRFDPSNSERRGNNFFNQNQDNFGDGYRNDNQNRFGVDRFSRPFDNSFNQGDNRSNNFRGNFGGNMNQGFNNNNGRTNDFGGNNFNPPQNRPDLTGPTNFNRFSDEGNFNRRKNDNFNRFGGGNDDDYNRYSGNDDFNRFGGNDDYNRFDEEDDDNYNRFADEDQFYNDQIDNRDFAQAPNNFANNNDQSFDYQNDPANMNAEEPDQDNDKIFEPEIVIDYDHKSKRPADIDVSIEPLRMFDYRHKPFNRIPLPERPQWLLFTVRGIREFDLLGPRLPKYPPEGMFRREVEKRPFPPAAPWTRIRGARVMDQEVMEKIMNAPPTPPTFRGQPPLLRNPIDNRPKFQKRPTETEKIIDLSKDDDDFEELSDVDEMDWSNEKEDKTDRRPLARITFSKGNQNKQTLNATKSNIISIDDLINPPGRYSRPPRIVIILRGPPGSGKTYLAKLIKDKEVENGGSAPRILSLDDYFMMEQEKTVIEDGKSVKVKEMVYEYEAEMEESYRSSLIKSFKKTITDGYFPFIIVDNVNDKVKYFGEMWSFAKQNGFQVYICQLDLDPQLCTKRNIHNRQEREIEDCIAGWEPTPSHHPIVDVSSLLQSTAIPEVEMEEVLSSDEENLKDAATASGGGNGNDEDEDEEAAEDQVRSKWDNFDCSINNLAKLDGVSKPLRPSQSMEEYLQLDDDWVTKPTKPGQKRVRWADLEEQKQQAKMRAIGFVVGQTNWNRMMDPSSGSSALTQTRFIERVKKY